MKEIIEFMKLIINTGYIDEYFYHHRDINLIKSIEESEGIKLKSYGNMQSIIETNSDEEYLYMMLKYSHLIKENYEK